MHDPHVGIEVGYLSQVGPLLLLAIVLVIGGIAGRFAQRLHVPAITGNILAGVILGPSLFNIVDGARAAESFDALSAFAMGIIGVTVGGQLAYRRIHNALRRIIVIATFEIVGATVFVFSLAYLLGAPLPECILLAAIAPATAPATTVALVREVRAKGTFVKTLLSVVAIDNIVCVVLFAFCMSILSDLYAGGGGDILLAITHVIWQLGGSILIGVVLGRATEWLGRSSLILNWSDFSLVFVSVLLSTGLGNAIDISPLLICLFYGVYMGNASEDSERQIRALAPMEPLLFIAFFTIAGASLHLNTLSEVGLLCAAYVVARITGKGIGAALGGALARSSQRIWSNMPLALAPQAGLAIGLVVLLEGDPHIPIAVKEQVTVLILAAVTANEIIGPLMTRLALRRANEAGLDRPRLIEFVAEEYIVCPLQAEDKWDALDQLTEFYRRSHRDAALDLATLRETVRTREEEMPTGIGKGVAIPHGKIESGDEIRGVLGILAEPVDWGSLDGAPVRLIMLVVTPKGQEHLHLEVLQCLAAMSSDERVRTQLFQATDANEAWEIIEHEETPNYNYFLEDEDAEPVSAT